MKTHLVPRILLVLSVLSGAALGDPSAATSSPKESKRWTDRFNMSACNWSATGRNDFFVLEPGYQEVLEGHEGKDSLKLEITVLNETKKVGSVETRIVEERETKNGALVEVSRNFFAVCGPANDVFYFGEDVDIYKDGKVVSHEDAWVAEKADARPGLFMPARPLLGARCYQEIAPEVAMDRIEIVSDSESLRTPAGEFRDCLRTEETTPLEPGVKEYKIYARGIGVIQDGSLLLTKYGSAASREP